MKYKLSNTVGILLFLVLTAFNLCGCYENHYYNRYHHHTRPWYDHHHMRPPAGVDFNRDVYDRH